MRRRALWLLALVTAGCASRGEQITAPTFDPQALCEEAARLSASEEHKPAVDTLTQAVEAGGRCSADVFAAVDGSQRRLREADALVRQGLTERNHGDLEAANGSFRRALEVYPKYYWVQKLSRDLDAEISAELAQAQAVELERQRSEVAEAHLERAQRAQLGGALAEAVDWVGRAIQARPADPLVRARLVDLARGLGLSLFSSGELMKARTLWSSALSLEPNDAQLLEYLEQVESRLRHLDQIKRDDPER